MTGRVNSFRIIHVLMIALLSGTGLNYVSVLGQAENEIPSFEGVNPGFTPPPESERTPPPPPSDALTVSELPTSPLERENETDVDPLSVTNRTEILEILPLNSTNIVEFVDEDLKNSTGVGLAPGSVLENIASAQEGQIGNLSNTTILDVLGPQEIEEVTNMTPTTTQGGEILDLDEIDIASANETEDEEVEEEEIVSPSVTTNETSIDNATNGATTTTDIEEEEIVSPSVTTNETSIDNATNGATGTVEVEEEQVTEEDEESPSQTGTPSTDQETTSLDNNAIDLDVNQTGGTLSENITNLNNTSVLPTSEDDSDESNNEDNEESNNEDNEESSDEESDENN
jgi:hypothetical protein